MFNGYKYIAYIKVYEICCAGLALKVEGAIFIGIKNKQELVHLAYNIGMLKAIILCN